MAKTRLLFVITQFFKGGAETATLNLLCNLSPDDYQIDFVVLNNLDIPGAISLVPEIPSWVTVIDPVHLLSGGEPAASPPPQKALQKCLRQRVGATCYDWAFHIGEWSSPEFVATEVSAHHKAVWVHNDLNIAEYFNGAEFFCWDAYIERYLFVSENSLAGSLKKYPFLSFKSTVAHNIIDSAGIQRRAQAGLQEDDSFFAKGIPVVLTCANVRLQKNHLRQVAAMALLKKQGVDFLWLNVGALPDEAYAEKVRESIRANNLDDRFLLLGNRDNPYPCMARADAVAVLSDYESWSMVITEALALGTPVIATKTSGALAQITPQNGLLVDFTPEAIAEGLKTVLAPKGDAAPAHGANNTFEQQGLFEFESLVRPAKKRRILYLMDDINYQSGVQKATFAQIKALSKDYDIALYSPVTAEKQALSQCPCPLLQPSPHRQFPHFYLRGSHVLGGAFPLSDKLAKVRQIVAGLLGRGAAYEKTLEQLALHRALEDFDVLVVPSEGSALRELAAGLCHPKKVQWIHTDYASWRAFDAFSQKASQNDGALYQNFDAIVTLSPRCQESFLSVHPQLADKTTAIENLLPREEILQSASEFNWFDAPATGLRLITVGRLHAEKNYMSLLSTAKKLRDDGILFCWYMVGGGPLSADMQEYIHENSLSGQVCLTGQLHNPYPLLAHADLFVLFSHYEGTPVTIREAQIFGVPTLARPVGGIPDLVQEGINGLFADDTDALYQSIRALAQDAQQLDRLKQGALAAKADTQGILRALQALFG